MYCYTYFDGFSNYAQVSINDSPASSALLSGVFMDSGLNESLVGAKGDYSFCYEGFIYSMAIYDTSMTVSDYLGAGFSNTGCIGDCTYCPDTECLPECLDPYFTSDCNSACDCGPFSCVNNDPQDCLKCDSTCSLSCKGNTPSDCLDLKQTYCTPHPFDQASLSCNWGLTCISNCYYCENAFECINCDPGYYADPYIHDCTFSCPTGFYEDTQGGQCLPCHQDCSTCSGPTNCLTCSASNSIVNSGTCACKEGFFASTKDPLTCEACDPACSSCVSKSECLACSDTSVTPPYVPGPCSCGVSQYIVSKSPLVCGDCYSYCATCTGSNPEDCITCIQSSVVPSWQGYCECPESKYAAQTSPLVCSNCSTYCIKCTESECLECQTGRSLQNGSCGECKKGYFETHNTCQPCESPCVDCEGSSSTCIECVDTMELEGTKCVCKKGWKREGSSCVGCAPGYLSLGTECVECPWGCLICNEDLKCLECNEFLVLKNYECFCQEKYQKYNGECVSVAGVTGALDSQNSVLLNFTEALETLNSQSLELSVKSSTNYRVEYSVEDRSSEKYYLSTKYTPSKITPNSFLVINFSRPIMYNQSKVYLNNTVLELELREEEPTIVEEVVKYAGTSFVLSTASVYLFLQDSGSLWTYLNTAQILAYIPLMNIDFPPMVQLFYKSFEAMDFIPNPFRFLYKKSENLPKRIQNYWSQEIEYSSEHFLVNSGKDLAVCFGVLGLWPLFQVLKLVCRWKPLTQKCEKVLSLYKWQCLTRLWLEVFLMLQLAGVVQLAFLDFYTLEGTVCSYLSSFVVFSGFYSSYKLALFIKNNFSKIAAEEEEFCKRWGTLFEEFRPESVFHLLYYPYFCLRRCIYVLVLYCLQSSPFVQVILNALHSLVCTLQLWVLKPYKVASENTINIAFELVVTTCFVLNGFYLLDLSDSWRAVVQWAQIGLVCGLLLWSYYLLVKSVWNSIKNCRKKKKVEDLYSINIQEAEPPLTPSPQNCSFEKVHSLKPNSFYESNKLF